MVLLNQNNVSKQYLPYSHLYTVTYYPCRVTSMSFLQVSVFSGHQLGNYFLNQVASTKMLVTMAPKVVAAWRVGKNKTGLRCLYLACVCTVGFHYNLKVCSFQIFPRLVGRMRCDSEVQEPKSSFWTQQLFNFEAADSGRFVFSFSSNFV